MLIFKSGKWHEVQLPDYIDPSWGVVERTRAAYGLLAGKSWEDIECEVFASLGISRE